MKKIFFPVFIFILLSIPFIVNSNPISALEFDMTEIENDERNYIEFKNKQYIGQKIINYSVSENKTIAVSASHSYINFYNSDCEFQYAYKFHLSGSEIFVEFINNDMYIYDYRMKKAYIIKDEKIQKLFAIKETLNNDKKWKELHENLIYNNGEYVLNSEKTILTKISDNKSIVIIDTASNNMIMHIQILITLIIVVTVFAYKRNRIIKSKPSIKNEF